MCHMGLIPVALRKADVTWEVDGKETSFSESPKEPNKRLYLTRVVLGLVEELRQRHLDKKNMR